MEEVSFLKEETRKRCKIIKVNAQSLKRYAEINTEVFHFLYDVTEIDFTIFLTVDDVMVEFIKPNEFSRELLDQIWAAAGKSTRPIRLFVFKKELALFQRLIQSIRNLKLKFLTEKDPNMDKRALQIFANLSNASQLIMKGGITKEVADQVTKSASYMMGNMLDYESAISTLSKMFAHDPTLYDHCASVAMLSGVIAQTCVDQKFGKKELEIIAQGGLYHDVGKTCVPSHILNKPGRFTDDEFTIMKSHAFLGEVELYSVIKEGTPIDPLVARAAGEHHERLDGSGYPKGCSGCYEDDNLNGIHIYTRIIMIADVYSALLQTRVYKAAYTPEKALEIMTKFSGKEYDPKIFPKFVDSVVSSLKAYENKGLQTDKSRILIREDDGSLTVVQKKIG